jgi:signal transduction histidine kinase
LQENKKMDSDKARILVVDDEPLVLDSCRKVLVEAGHVVNTASGGQEAVEKLSRGEYDLMLLDLKMPDLDGLEVLHLAKSSDPAMVIAIITGYATVDTAVEAMKNGAYDYISKPISASSLEMLAKRALETARLQKELARVEREKEHFIHTIYHEFKSPIADITVFLRTLKKILPLDERQQRTLSLCEKKLIPLKELTEDLLQMTRAEFMQQQKKIVTFNLLDVVRLAALSHTESAAEASITIEIDPASESISIETEREGVLTVLNNLIRNALRYNKPGGSVRLKTGQNDDLAWIEVSDTGIGIAEEHQAMIYDEFYRIRDEATRDIAGTGLGLSIVKRILDSLGGKITLRSELGEGSTFTVALPVASGTHNRPAGDTA